MTTATGSKKKENQIKFFWNGIKVNDGRLEQAYYTIGNYTESSGIAEDTITITVGVRNSKLYFSKAVHEIFCGLVKNETDSQQDYFDVDRIRVPKTHKLYQQVKKAMEQCEARRELRIKAA